MPEHCIFCETVKNNVKDDSKFFIVEKDKYPVSKGHVLIIPKRHIEKSISLNSSEWEELGIVINTTMNYSRAKYFSEGFNVGFNQGKMAGQTIKHFHIHIIPRYEDDVENPLGGIRNVIPEKGNYLVDSINS